jgi:outer membrane protein assembly factor BamA
MRILLISLCLLFCFNAWTIKAEEPDVPLVNPRMVGEIMVSGNYRTHRSVIVAELLFHEGELIEFNDLPDLIERSRENIQNTSLFNIVTIDWSFPDINTVNIFIVVEERWYIWAFPLFEAEGRNFSDFLRTNDGDNFNYGLYLKHDNFRGRHESLKLRFITGYRTQAILDYQNPALNHKSGWGAKMVWYMFDKMAYQTDDDQQVFLEQSGDQLFREMSFHLSYSYRYHHDFYHSIMLSYFDVVAADTILALNPDYLPGGNTTSRTLEFSYTFDFDTRDSKIYPLNGLYAQFVFARKGMVVDSISDWTGFFQSEVLLSWQKQLLYRWYGKTDLKISLIDKQDVPYFYQSGLGYNEYLNGFEYSVIDGTSYVAWKNKLIFGLVPRRDVVWKRMPLKQFSRFHYALYLKFNLDAGYVINRNELDNNYMANSVLLGYGPGIDLVTIYDQVWGFNYSFNNFGDQGFFLHFNLAL